MTPQELAAIRERHDRYREWDGGAKSQLCDDIAALLAHIEAIDGPFDEVYERLRWTGFNNGKEFAWEVWKAAQARFSALTPDVIETCLRWRQFYVSVHEDYALNESEQDRAARAALESMKEKT